MGCWCVRVLLLVQCSEMRCDGLGGVMGHGIGSDGLGGGVEGGHSRGQVDHVKAKENARGSEKKNMSYRGSVEVDREGR